MFLVTDHFSAECDWTSVIMRSSILAPLCICTYTQVSLRHPFFSVHLFSFALTVNFFLHPTIDLFPDSPGSLSCHFFSIAGVHQLGVLTILVFIVFTNDIPERASLADNGHAYD